MNARPDGSLAPLIIPRRLAIALLAEAQRHEQGPVHGVIGARDGVPVSVSPGVAVPPAPGETAWAHYRSGTVGSEAKVGRQLLISLDTKGVLQLRCWDDGAVERELHIV